MSNYYRRVPSRRRLLVAFAAVSFSVTTLAVATAGPSFGNVAANVVVEDDVRGEAPTTTLTAPNQVTTTTASSKPAAAAGSTTLVSQPPTPSTNPVIEDELPPIEDGGPTPVTTGKTPCDQGGASGTAPTCPAPCDQGGPTGATASSGSCAAPCEHGGATPAKPAEGPCDKQVSGKLLPVDDPVCLSHPTLQICQQLQPNPPVTTPPSTTLVKVPPSTIAVQSPAGGPASPGQAKPAVSAAVVFTLTTRQADAVEPSEDPDPAAVAALTAAVPPVVNNSPPSSVALQALKHLAQSVPTPGAGGPTPTVSAVPVQEAGRVGTSTELAEPGRRRLTASAPATQKTSRRGIVAPLAAVAGALVGYALSQGKRPFS